MAEPDRRSPAIMYECECGRKLENKAGYVSHKQHCDGGYDGMCLNCGEEPARRYSKGSDGRFCSPECGRAYVDDDTLKKRNAKISESLKEKSYPKPSLKNRISKTCDWCGGEFETVPSKKEKRFCCRQCFESWHQRSSNEKAEYRKRCKFDFNVWDYPEWFDLSLISRFGWYKPSNRGNNLGGVSRDHLFSVKRGWELDIDPYLISHPANCQLLPHEQNNSKNSDCSVSLRELKGLVICFYNTYGPVAESG